MILRVLLLLSLFTALALVVTACAMPMRPVSSPATAPLAARVVVRWRDVRQRIDGFGADAQAANLMRFPEPGRSHIVDLLFSPTNGIGLSMLREEIGCGNAPELGTIEPRPGVFTFAGDRGQVWLMKQAARRGPITILSTVWSPPAWMKTNHDCSRGGYLSPAHYLDYARYLSAYVRGYKKYHGITISAISPANEPNGVYPFQSSQWTGRQFHDFIAHALRPVFTRDGVRAAVAMPEQSWHTHDDLITPTLDDPASAAAVTIIAGHGYHHNTAPWSIANVHHKRTWQTEVSYLTHENPGMGDGLHWAENIHAFMTRAGANAWLWWWAVNSDGTKGDGEGIIYLTPARRSYFISKRLYTIGNYSRFIRPGYVRLAATDHPAAGIYTSAYRDPSGHTLVVVAIDDTGSARTIDVRADGAPVRRVTPYVTSATQNLAQGHAIVATGEGFSATLPARSVTTFVATTR